MSAPSVDASVGATFRLALLNPLSARRDILFLRKGETHVRVGCFTPLLSQLPLPDVLKKLKSIHI
ncbi:MAG: hypothetical protein ABSH49_33085, partial [Bryobacteraceae bacterium]